MYRLASEVPPPGTTVTVDVVWTDDTYVSSDANDTAKV